MRALTKKLLFRAPFSNFSRMFASSKEEFEDAVKSLASLENDPGNETKLQLYALYKQATIGKCNIPKPGLIDFTGKVKWEAWNSLQDMSQSEAQSNYVDIVKKLTKPSSKKADYEKKGPDIISEIDGKVYKIVINCPSRKNALTTEMYEAISDSLEEATKSDATLAVLTGAGDFYSSGNDLANILKAGSFDYNQYVTMGRDLLKRFVSTFIDFPKPLIAVVNGPAIGIMTTTLPLFDGVFASDRATFQTMFTSLGMTPEGCSSFTFPLIMGHTKACDMLLFNKKITAYEAKDLGLVTDVFPSSSFQEEAWKKVIDISASSPQVLRLSKNLVRENFRRVLHDVNEQECNLLLARWLSQDFKDTILDIVQKKSSL